MSRLVVRHTFPPISLVRIQPKMPVQLRDYDSQMAIGRSSFDLKLVNGLYVPAVGDTFSGPNGMSLRPPTSPKMHDVLRAWKGPARIYTLHEGLVLPDGLVILHEHSDHYSLQTTRPIALDEYCANLTKFLQTLPSQTIEQFFAMLEDENDQNN